jgi:hypothetical protein
MCHGQSRRAQALAVLAMSSLAFSVGGFQAAAEPLHSRSQVTPSGTPSKEKCQLRVFTINRGKLEEFTRAWRAGVYPLRQKHGFTVPAAWAVSESNQFVWLLCYAGPEEWEAKERSYYASEERSSLHPDPRQFIARVERWFVTPVVP